MARQISSAPSSTRLCTTPTPARIGGGAAAYMSSQASRSTASIWAIFAGSIIVPLPLDRRFVSPCGRCPDDNRLAGLQHRRVAAGELVDAAILAPHGILADLSVTAAGEPERQ